MFSGCVLGELSVANFRESLGWSDHWIRSILVVGVWATVKWHWGPREIGVTSLAIVGSEDQVIIFLDPPLDSGMPQGQWNGPL